MSSKEFCEQSIIVWAISIILQWVPLSAVEHLLYETVMQSASTLSGAVVEGHQQLPFVNYFFLRIFCRTFLTNMITSPREILCDEHIQKQFYPPSPHKPLSITKRTSINIEQSQKIHSCFISLYIIFFSPDNIKNSDFFI